MSPSERRSLLILREHGPLNPGMFAHFYFPRDHPGWDRISKVGTNGSARGVGLWRWAGGYLGRLQRKGWVVWSVQEWHHLGIYSLSHLGREALEA